MLSLNFQRLATFSLRSLFLVVTLGSLGFAVWWQWPFEVSVVPPELGKIRQPNNSWCGSVPERDFLWREEPRPRDPHDSSPFDPFADRGGGTIYPARGKCQARRRGLSGWILDGPAEIYTQKGERVIEARYASGKLHGQFRSWFTTGQLRETGQYVAGQRDGVWTEFEQYTGNQALHHEYAAGRKIGVWTYQQYGTMFFDHYQGGRLALREIEKRFGGEWIVQEYDANEKLQRVSYWNKERTQELGADHYLAGVRHGSWYRLEFDDNHPIVQHGQFVDGLAVGEWVFERHERPADRLIFHNGALLELNGEPVFDLLRERNLTESTREDLLKVKDRYWSGQARWDAFQYLLFQPALFIDPRLDETPDEFAAGWDQEFPWEFRFTNLPTSAALALCLHDAGWVLDYRVERYWLTRRELAAAWQDETGTGDWFGPIANTPWITTKDAEGYSQVVDSPYVRQDRYFGEDWQAEWESDRKLEFREPLRSSTGAIARRLDGSKVPMFSRLQLPAELREYTPETPYRFNERIAWECELYHCCLVLDGDTLVMEPRGQLTTPSSPRPYSP